MTKPTITSDQHITELNRRLRLHRDYREGMAFVAYPEGSTGSSMSGYSVTGPFGLMGIYAQVAHEVSSHFNLAV